MKKIILMAAVGGALAAAAPAQADGISLRIGGANGGIVIADGKVHTYRAPSAWHHTAYYNDIRRGHHGGNHNGGLRAGFTYIPGIVAKVQQQTGAKVTDIVYRNGVYHVQGWGRQGRFNTAKVDPYSGRIYDVQRARPSEPTPSHALGIRRLLAEARQHGYSRFDRVDLQAGVYKVRGLNKRGKPVVLRMNARNGKIQNVRAAARYNLPQQVQRSRKPFTSFRDDLRKQHYSHFTNATYVKGNNDWPDHYQVRGRNQRGQTVDLRVCAYTGQVLGWRNI